MSLKFSRDFPFLASIKEGFKLNPANELKSTYHFVIDLKDSQINYQAGDSVAIYPQNHPEHVKDLLQLLCAEADSSIILKKTNEKILFKDFLTHKANISQVPKKLIQAVFECHPEQEKKDFLNSLIENSAALSEYQAHHELVHFVRDFLPPQLIALQDFADLLSNLLPRFYSIASSSKEYPTEIHLTVAVVKYLTSNGERFGICTRFLEHALSNTHLPIPLYIQPTRHFLPPENLSAPVIMIGPGTGIAPFRAFMQERHAQGASKNWLFFGEWHRDKDFFYEKEWMHYEKEGFLKITTAFSRDQEQKVYVQHRILEEGEHLWDWLEQGAYIYVCGDASKMAKGVEEALHKVIEIYGKISAEESAMYIKDLRKVKRYLKDVY